MTKLITINKFGVNQRALASLLVDKVVFAYPGETGYCLACKIDDLVAVNKIRQLKQVDNNHLFTVCFNDIKAAAKYVVISNQVFKMMRMQVDYPVTFILPVAKAAPKNLYNKKRKSLGVRIVSNALDVSLVNLFAGAMLSSSAINADNWQIVSAADVETKYFRQLDYILEQEPIVTKPSILIDCCQSTPVILRNPENIDLPY